MDSRAELEENLDRVRRAIAEACAGAGRDPSSVRIVAVAKEVPVGVVGWAIEAGVEDVGENYVRELEAKREALGAGRWHYVGTLQSHTAARVAERADVVHSLSPGRAAERLGRRAAQRPSPLPVLYQVDFTGRRHGVSPEELPGFAARVRSMEGLAPVGLMTLPPAPERAEDSRPFFRRLRELRDELAGEDETVRELSMGMSADLRVAVEEGASMVRIGTALFGARAPAR
ncbi:MAG: YggS family pyridoxal phosphate-dependent enzyme [Actinobacteria bacterium]|nr:YggS family pyridoxal phosphate-dependent enzyme [Actinomycetota bacterium]